MPRSVDCRRDTMGPLAPGEKGVKSIAPDMLFRVFTACPGDARTLIVDVRPLKEYNKNHILQSYCIRLSANGKALLVSCVSIVTAVTLGYRVREELVNARDEGVRLRPPSGCRITPRTLTISNGQNIAGKLRNQITNLNVTPRSSPLPSGKRGSKGLPEQH